MGSGANISECSEGFVTGILEWSERVLGGMEGGDPSIDELAKSLTTGVR